MIVKNLRRVARSSASIRFMDFSEPGDVVEVRQ
jgi:hypothetical protein